MAPPVTAMPVSELEAQLQTLPAGRRRRDAAIELRDCALRELVQYKCNVHKPEARRGVPRVVCEPVVRMLRRCQGGLSVETTAWEGWKARQDAERGDHSATK